MQWLRQRGLSLLRQSGVAQGNFGVALAAPISRVPAEATPVGGIWEALRGLAPSLTDATWLAVPKKRVSIWRMWVCV